MIDLFEPTLILAGVSSFPVTMMMAGAFPAQAFSNSATDATLTTGPPLPPVVLEGVNSNCAKREEEINAYPPFIVA